MRKTAILFGNNEYQSGDEQRLKCSVHDAEDLSEKLELLGFNVTCIQNSSRNEMATRLAQFETELSQYDVGLFFFSGHGFQFDGKNYLAPIDASFYDRSSASYTSFDLDIVIQSLNRSSLQTKILIIDACRTGTFPGERGGTVGLAPVFAPRGTLIAFATSPGQAAIERGDYGLFTNAVLQHIMTENLTIENMFKRVRNTVYVLSEGRQITWEHTSLMGDFFFNNRRVGESDKTIYSKAALADSLHECALSSVLVGVISKLKTCNYKVQNPAISELSQLNLNNEMVDDLFVLGRNLYQCSDNAFAVSRYFESLEGNLLHYSQSVSKHILAGMAYEVYFDSNGKLRQHLKIHRFEDVFRLILRPKYRECCDFIATQLQNNTQKILYIPGSGGKIVLDIILKREQDDGLYIEGIALDGQRVLYNDEGTELYEYNSYHSRICSVEEIKNDLHQEVGCLKNALEINWICDKKIDDAIEHGINAPYQYSLLRYAN